MDVHVPAIPASYDAYRAKLRAVVTAHRPDLEWKQRAGLRAPEDRATVEVLRSFVRAVYDAGYVLQRFSSVPGDPIKDRILDEELAATGLPYVLGNPLVAGALLAFGTEAQQATYLPAIGRGDHIWTQLFSEPDAGSDLTSLKTRGQLDGDDYVINGQKVWSTWAQWSDYGYLLARTEPVDGAAGISAFVLDMRTPGVEIRPLREMTGTADFCEVFFEDVRVPAANLIGAPGEGWRVAGASLVTERSGVGGGRSGSLVSGLVALAGGQRRGDGTALEDSAVRQAIGGYAARSRIQKALSYKMATKAGKGALEASDAPISKIWFSELNLEVAEYALALQGPSSAAVEEDAVDGGRWQDAFLYARAWTIAGGSNEIMRNLIAERGLGLPREPRGQR
jgi:alkylation response protein AidB-like acyl-CoA dehydrogenase